MELILNLVWLLVVGGIFAAFAAWAAGQPHGAVSRYRHFTIVVALGCVAAVLFPIISMSDDLATAPAAVEAWNSMRRSALIAFVIVVSSPLLVSSTITTVVAQINRSVHLACIGLVTVTVVSILSPSISTIWSFRAPPLARF